MKICFYTKEKSMSLIVMIVLFLIVTLMWACVPMPVKTTQKVWSKPNFTQQEFAKDKYECIQQAQQTKYRAQGATGSGMFYVPGSASSDAVTNSTLFTLCMEARGWSEILQENPISEATSGVQSCYNLQEVMKNTNAGKAARTDFGNFYEKKSAIIKDVEKDLKSRKADLEKNGANMTPEAKKEAESDYQNKLKEYQLLVNNTNDELKKRDAEIIQQLLIPQIMIVVNRIKEKEKYTSLLEESANRITCSKDKDITKRIIDECNQYPVVFTTKHVEAEQPTKPAIQNSVIPTSNSSSIQPTSEQSNKSETLYSQKLHDLKKLKDEGLLTDKEYEQKRKAIVDAM